MDQRREQRDTAMTFQSLRETAQAAIDNTGENATLRAQDLLSLIDANRNIHPKPLAPEHGPYAHSRELAAALQRTAEESQGLASGALESLAGDYTTTAERLLADPALSATLLGQFTELLSEVAVVRAENRVLKDREWTNMPDRAPRTIGDYKKPGAAPHHYGPDDVVVDGDWLEVSLNELTETRERVAHLKRTFREHEKFAEMTLAPALGYELYPPGSPGYSKECPSYVIGDHTSESLMLEAARLLSQTIEAGR